jgi:hypothetical protein
MGQSNNYSARTRGARNWRRAAPRWVAWTALIVLLPVGEVATSAAAHASGPTQDATYVAIGDGYASGEGLGPYQAGTAVPKGGSADTCHRSARAAYPDLATVVPSVRSSQRAFWACSGATVADMEETPGTDGSPAESGQPDQIATVGPKTQYVTLTAGADSIGLGALGDACVEGVVHGKVVHLAKTSCADQLATSKAALGDLVPDLETLYLSILDTASPSAEMVVTGYPRIFAGRYTGLGKEKGAPFCVLGRSSGLGVVGLPLSAAESVASLESGLDTAIDKAVKAVDAERPGHILVADVTATSVPQSCRAATPKASVGGFAIGSKEHGVGPHGVISAGTFHATALGEKVLAAGVAKRFKAFTTLRGTIRFLDPAGKKAPPAKLGGYRMTAFRTDTRPVDSAVTSITGPTGAVGLSTPLDIFTVPAQWRTWSHRYRSVVYYDPTSTSDGVSVLTFTLPKHTVAFSFYAEPNAFETFDLAASANNGVSSGDQTVLGKAGAKMFGFVAAHGATISSVTVTCDDTFAVAELAIARQKA